MSISRTSKMNGVATQLKNKKPNDCYISKKEHITIGKSFNNIQKENIVNSDQIMISKTKVNEWNDKISISLHYYPDSKVFKELDLVFKELGIRK